MAPGLEMQWDHWFVQSGQSIVTIFDVKSQIVFLWQRFHGLPKTQILSFRGAFFAEECLFFLGFERREIPRFARNDNSWDFFRSLFSLWG
jgi:hypothetical protein